jgi:hypothetical protein
MEQHANPIEYLIEFAWANGADRFVVNNAKDELKRLKAKYEKLDPPVAWAKINQYGDLYDLRLQNNPYNDQKTVVPLYRQD